MGAAPRRPLPLFIERGGEEDASYGEKVDRICLCVLPFVLFCRFVEETYQKTSGIVIFDAEVDVHSLVTDFAYSNISCKAGKPNFDDWFALVKTRDPAAVYSAEERVSRSGETYSFVALTGEFGSGFYNESTGVFKYSTLLGEQVNTMLAYYSDPGDSETFLGSELSFLSAQDVIRFVNQQTPTLMGRIDV